MLWVCVLLGEALREAEASADGVRGALADAVAADCSARR